MYVYAGQLGFPHSIFLSSAKFSLWDCLRKPFKIINFYVKNQVVGKKHGPQRYLLIIMELSEWQIFGSALWI